MTAIVQAEIDSTLKDQATAVLTEIGMTMNQVVTAVLTRVVRDHEFPLDLCELNAETLEALAEFERGEAITCSSVEEMYALIDDSECENFVSLLPSSVTSNSRRDEVKTPQN